MSTLDIRIIPVINDNYIYLVRDPDTGSVAVVDPAVAEPVLQEANSIGWEISHILITHPHYDHVGGVEEIKSKTGARVIGAAGDASVIPGIDQTVADGESVRIGHARARVIGVPGHTTHHVAYWFEDGKVLFPGDTLFSLGCGRLFGGTATEMWASLKKLRQLPPDTMIYPAHEYTNANADFALTIEKSNKNLKARAKQALAQRKKGLPTVPTTLSEEKLCNPFLRADIGLVQAAVGMKGRDAAEVFAEIRKRKDNF